MILWAQWGNEMRGYFIDQSQLYELEALKERSEDLINAYKTHPKVFAELLVRMGFFMPIKDEDDIARHNTLVTYLYDMGIFGSDNPLIVAEAFLGMAKVPDEYLGESEYGGKNDY